MLQLLADSLVLMPGQGLSDLWETILDDWLTPIYLAAIAVFAIVFIKNRAWMQLISFVGIAAIVGVFVFFGEDIFGSDDGLTGTAADLAGDIGAVVSTSVLPFV